MNTNEKLRQLRDKMKFENIDAVIVPTSDPHQSEYLPEHYKARDYISGFDGSNGIAVITLNEAKIWTDGRYFIQCKHQIAGSEFELMKLNTPGYPTVIEYIGKTLKKGQVVAINGNILSEQDFREYQAAFDKKELKFVSYPLVESIWLEQPPIPKEKIFILDEKFAGKTRREKLDILRKAYHKKGANSYFISSLESIAWLLNIRGHDIPTNPVTISYLYVNDEGAIFFIHSRKVSTEIIETLERDSIYIVDYDRVFGEIKAIKGKKIYLNISETPRPIYRNLKSDNTIIEGKDLVGELKSVKNPTEQANQKHAYIEDGVALTKFIYWLKQSRDKGILTELSAQDYLHKLRSARDGFIEESFETISAYGSNAAMMHYSAAEDNYSQIGNSGFLLVDSGGQYLYGTTDTTRTIAMGPLTEDEIHDYTLTLKSSIALLDAKFLEGTRDADLDAIARMPMWKEGKDYKCGTGHGVGYLLSVHEGPPTFSFASKKPSILKEGQIVTVEPGVYREDKYGIRIENVVIVKKWQETEDGVFYRFENMTCVPLEPEAIDVTMLTDGELDWLNDYQQKVFETISPSLTEEEVKWLKTETKPLVRDESRG